jgi:hypothetical protein
MAKDWEVKILKKFDNCINPSYSKFSSFFQLSLRKSQVQSLHPHKAKNQLEPHVKSSWLTANAGSHRNPRVKQGWVRLVPGWGTDGFLEVSCEFFQVFFRIFTIRNPFQR